MLEADHVRVETLFRDYQSSNSDAGGKLDLAQIICNRKAARRVRERAAARLSAPGSFSAAARPDGRARSAWHSRSGPARG